MSLNSIVLSSKAPSHHALEKTFPKLKEMLATVTRKHASIEKVVERSMKGKSALFEIAALLKYKHELFPELITTAVGLNKKAFDREIEFYGVSYVSDMCINSCTYCGHSSLMPQERSMLDKDELRKDLAAVLKHGPTDLCILAGEHPSVTPEYLAMAANIAQEIDASTLNALRRITFNVAPMTSGGFKKLTREANKPLQFRIFQESYDIDVYKKHHKKCLKDDFSFRLGAQERALQNGFYMVGIGSLMGLNDNDFSYVGSGNDYEILALVAHANYLSKFYERTTHSLSIPRLQTVEGSDFEIPKPVNDITYAAYHAILKLALPRTRLILTRRETPEIMDALRPMISIEDLAVKPGVGGNYKKDVHFQNDLGDTRTTPEIVNDVREKGYTALVKGV